MTEQEIEQFPKSASEYLYKQKDLTYKQEIHLLFEVIKYYKKELKDANAKVVHLAETVSNEKEELKQLRKFKKDIRKFQEKLYKYEDNDLKFMNVAEEIMYF